MGLDKEKIKRETKGIVENTTKEDLLKVKRNFKKFVRFYNQVCFKCRQKLIKNPKMTVSEYCTNCQAKWKVIADEEWK